MSVQRDWQSGSSSGVNYVVEAQDLSPAYRTFPFYDAAIQSPRVYSHRTDRVQDTNGYVRVFVYLDPGFPLKSTLIVAGSSAGSGPFSSTGGGGGGGGSGSSAAAYFAISSSALSSPSPVDSKKGRESTSVASVRKSCPHTLRM